MFGPKIRQWGLDIHVGEGDSLHLLHNINHDPHIIDFIKNNLHPKDIFIDVGAHIGYYSLLASTLISQEKAFINEPLTSVYAYEPSVLAYDVLMKNIYNNNKEHIINAYNIGIGSIVEERITLYEQTEGWGQNSRCERLVDRGLYLPREVFSDTLDNQFPGKPYYKHPYIFLKSDTQGNEVNVLRGAQRLLGDKEIKAMALEIWPLGLEAMDSNVRELYDLIGNDFIIMTHVIDPGDSYHLVSCNYDEAMVIYGEGSNQRKHGDILCIRKS